MKKNRSYSYIYLILWGVPLIFFIRDFFNFEDIKSLNLYETWELFKISLTQGVLSVFFATIVAIIPAYYMSYRKNILTKMLEGLIFIPFFFPTISTVVAFTLIFNLPILKNFNVLYTLKAIIFANVFYNSPIMIKYLSEGMRNIPKNIIEAGKIDGLNEIGIFFRIKLPLIFPQVFRGMFLVFIYTFTSFGIVLALGGIRYSNLEVEIANTLLRDANFSKALILGIIQFIFLIIINLLGDFYSPYELQDEYKEKRVSIGTKIYSFIYLLLEYSIVAIGIFYGFYNYYTGKFSLNGFFRLFTSEFNITYPVLQGIRNSLLLASITPLFVIVFTYLILKNFSRLTSTIVFSTMGFSSAFLGIALIYINILYDIKLWILLVIGYFLITVPIAYSFMYQYVREFPKDILDLAKIDALSPFKTFILVEFPILKNVFLGTYLQIFAIILGEFTISYSMQLGREFPTIALVNYSLFSDKKLLEGAALSSINIIIVAVLFYLSNKITEKNNGGK
ncbi:ABC transporter permease [Candidatus Cetobacterium colombiensis]|uniref:ABC transporter permease subunit n=1 Tax=Candidatus Cetobacterium colombiensis TaxID=3073100 RepID=A0ABU4WB47_9FUSO|nr:ABC transporter permease subunit [Candidatus Cetobacterium colombiensis]MDX8335620.1 ABC transporter permease subunit [Candidatus Cetobacterium colombiensis]